MTQEINVIVPPPIVVDVIIPGQSVNPPPPIIIGPGQGGSIGAQGVQGTQGLQGPIGITPVVSYRHIQGISSAVWAVNHNLGFYPNVTVEDSAGTIVEGDIDYIDQNSLQLTFSSPFSGYAYLS